MRSHCSASRLHLSSLIRSLPPRSFSWFSCSCLTLQLLLLVPSPFSCSCLFLDPSVGPALVQCWLQLMAGLPRLEEQWTRQLLQSPSPGSSPPQSPPQGWATAAPSPQAAGSPRWSLTASISAHFSKHTSLAAHLLSTHRLLRTALLES